MNDQEPVDDFPDINLDILRERTASMRPGRHSLVDRPGAEQIGLPPEPGGRVVVEAVNDEGGMARAWWPHGGAWVDSIGPLEQNKVYELHTWAEVLAYAVAAGHKLYVREQGPKPKE